MTSVNGLLQFARHEIRLSFRDFVAAILAKGRRRSVVIAGALIITLVMFVVAYIAVRQFAGARFPLHTTQLIVMTATLLISWALMLSQAIESVTRVLYVRADLDLIMSSPANPVSLFAIRIAAVAVMVTAMTLILSLPFVIMLVALDGVQWLATIGMVFVTGLSTTAMGIIAVVVIFALVGPRYTRLVTQIISAIIGAGYVIGLQITAIFSYGTLSRFSVLTSEAVISHAPGYDSVVWWPVRAALGDGMILLVLLVASVVMMLGMVLVFAPVFVTMAMRIASNPATVHRQNRESVLRDSSPGQALRRKELALLMRNPWLLSQSLMQLLYLVPPSIMLLKNMSSGGMGLMVLTPAIVMAAGQLAGGLTWLMISGEDAPELIATAPVAPSHITRSKIEVVLILLGAIFAPIILGLGLASPLQAAVTVFGLILSVVSATVIQLRFRVQGRHSTFRRRHTASRLATFAESFSAIGWAATSAFILSSPLIAAILAVMTVTMLTAVLKISPGGIRGNTLARS